MRNNPTEADIEAQARAMHDSGLVAHGYTYLNIDDFYYLNPATTVDSGGRWAIDPNRFPHGMAAVADYVHGLGEKFGMYLTPGIPVAAYQQNTHRSPAPAGTPATSCPTPAGTRPTTTSATARCTTSTTPRTRPPRRRS
ncbi:hypothetical protein [Kutzneria kofuensis]|uniref:hypothetical protein n=1 Tax=Kutzneria kofuensis TaxID=103725 RepID=UPI0031EAB3CC